jgi:hypothetical protein
MIRDHSSGGRSGDESGVVMVVMAVSAVSS